MPQFLSAARLAVPIIAGYIPLGFACGVICVNVGMTVFQVVVMSIFVFAGAAQYIAAGMIGAGASPLSITITILIVNLRHLLYTSALYPYISSWSSFKKAVFAVEITDETFGLHSSLMAKRSDYPFPFALGINTASHFGWVLGNAIGAVSSSLFADSKAFGFDFALPALFIALLVPRLITKPQILACLVAGICSLIFSAGGVDYWGIIVASVFGSTIAMFFAGRSNA